MKTMVFFILALLFAVNLNAQTDSIRNAMPATYEAIRIRAVNIWVSLYDEQAAEIDRQCAALSEYLAIEKKCADTLQDVFDYARTRTFNRYAKGWSACENQCSDPDLLLACINPDWVKATAKLKKIINRELNPKEFSFTLEL